MTEKEGKLTKAGFNILTNTRVTNAVDIVSSPFTHRVGISPTLGLSHTHGKSSLTFLLWSDMTYLSWSCSALIYSFFSFFFFLPHSSSYLKKGEMKSKEREGHNILLSTYVIDHMLEYFKYITFFDPPKTHGSKYCSYFYGEMLKLKKLIICQKWYG